MKNVVVLGAGLVGSLIAKDLASSGDLVILAVDRSHAALDALGALPNLRTAQADLASPTEIAEVVRGADAVVGAVPGFLGTAMLRAVLECRVPVADISFSPEDPFLLDDLARKAGVPAVVDCGVSPGLSNLVAGRAAARFDEADSIRIFVGGLPFRRVWPFEYRIVFSAVDVIEEYTRPARVVENGVVMTKPALSEIELVDFPVVGTLEAFLTDGLRTVLHTLKARRLEEKTLRYPGHAEKMRLLRETGFFRETPIELNGAPVIPRALAERLLFEAWRRPPDEDEFTVLKVVCEGSRNGKRERHEFGLFDRTDPVTRATSMARTTGFPCAIAVRQILSGGISTPGILPLEKLGADASLYEAFRAGLADRGVLLSERVEVHQEAEPAGSP